jgi:Peptidase M1 N-terminal domain
MFQVVVSVLLCLVISANGQRSKLYRDFDPTIDRFSSVNRQGVAYRLPNDTIPLRYDIGLTTRIDLGNFFFNGNVAIRFLVLQSTNQVTIHSKQLTISSVSLKSASGFQLPITFQLDAVTEFLTVTLQLGNFALNQEYILTVVYYGELRKDDQGFYRSSYVNGQGETV